MSDDEQQFPSEEIDWMGLRTTQCNLAEMVWSYNAALLNAGFDKPDALGLTMAYQQMIIAQSDE